MMKAIPTVSPNPCPCREVIAHALGAIKTWQSGEEATPTQCKALICIITSCLPIPKHITTSPARCKTSKLITLRVVREITNLQNTIVTLIEDRKQNIAGTLNQRRNTYKSEWEKIRETEEALVRD